MASVDRLAASFSQDDWLAAMDSAVFDDLDRQILDSLQRDARDTAASHIAQAAGVSTSTVR